MARAGRRTDITGWTKMVVSSLDVCLDGHWTRSRCLNRTGPSGQVDVLGMLVFRRKTPIYLRRPSAITIIRLFVRSPPSE